MSDSVYQFCLTQAKVKNLKQLQIIGNLGFVWCCQREDAQKKMCVSVCILHTEILKDLE